MSWVIDCYLQTSHTGHQQSRVTVQWLVNVLYHNKIWEKAADRINGCKYVSVNCWDLFMCLRRLLIICHEIIMSVKGISRVIPKGTVDISVELLLNIFNCFQYAWIWTLDLLYTFYYFWACWRFDLTAIKYLILYDLDAMKFDQIAGSYVISFINPSVSFFDFNILMPGQNGRHFVDAIFKCIFLNENIWIPIKISL